MYTGCDLLSNCIFKEFYHIEKIDIKEITSVVICFQIVSLKSSITSLGETIRLHSLL